MTLQLFENFNTTNQTSPHFEMHLSFAMRLKAERCEALRLMDPLKRCDFATTAKSCLEQVHIINYTRHFYCLCDRNDLLKFICFLILFLNCALFFWITYVTTSRFFVPAFQEVTRVLNLNEYLAGITVMAVGNNVPSVVNTFTGGTSEARHIYTEAMSVNLFVCTFMTATIIWIRPFAMDGTFFMRDVGFVLLYVSYVDFIFKMNEYITTLKAISMTSIYVAHITIILLDEYLQHRKRRRKTNEEFQPHIDFDMQSLPKSSWNYSLGLNPPSANHYLFKQFFQAVDTLDRKSFRSQWLVLKLWALIKIIPLFCLRLFIPQMDFHKAGYGWSKLLCIIQIILVPNLLLLSICYQYKVMSVALPLCVACLIVCTPIAAWVTLNSRTDMVPKWYPYVTFLTIITSVFVLYFVSKELVSLLSTLGLTLNCSHNFIGCTLLTWGSSLSDFMSCISMARMGYSRLAFAACFGIPIFNTFINIAVPTLYNAINSEEGYVEDTEGTVGETSSTFLLIAILAFILYGITTDFQMRRTGAILGLVIYAMFLIFSSASEFELIHAFGTDHSQDRSHFDDSYSKAEKN